VAIWRVALLVWFLNRLAGLKGLTILVGTLLPLSLIVMALAVLNLEHVIFSIMSGIRPEQHSSNDVAYGIVTILAAFSFAASPFLIIAYLWLTYRAQTHKPPPKQT
jgi:uncharacterized membrane protein HdeD (DUF308 family)